MGDPDAQCELGCHLRVENDYVQSEQQAFYYLGKAIDQGHAGAAIAYRSFLLRGAQFPESLMKFNLKRRSSTKKAKNHESTVMNPVEMAKEHFLVAAKAGSALGLKWLPRLEEVEKRLLTERSSKDLYQAKLIHLKLDICDTSGIPYYLMFDQRPINILH
ncbi:uncharacterized protein LOC110649332 isoform X2 [Hevea brasiliensis]|uniref:uncharacterized protein LOC110649332 isoform X2 n=1 Tax=Hevea brasiliensis TaxID=3981 RepID=UPI002600805D|nr:uncharacterized protein LOC110649332 isoform X2 [Hevea brasiliensis]